MNDQAVIELGNAIDLGKPWDGPMLPQIHVHHARGYGKTTYAKTCASKSRFSCKKEAQTAVNAAADRRRNPAILRAYPCPMCAGWHLTRQV